MIRVYAYVCGEMKYVGRWSPRPVCPHMAILPFGCVHTRWKRYNSDLLIPLLQLTSLYLENPEVPDAQRVLKNATLFIYLTFFSVDGDWTVSTNSQ